jgi:hypothetical protein
MILLTNDTGTSSAEKYSLTIDRASCAVIGFDFDWLLLWKAGTGLSFRFSEIHSRSTT